MVYFQQVNFPPDEIMRTEIIACVDMYISGFLEDVAMTVIPQTQFTPLPEVLCLVISKLNRDSATRAASLEAILQELAHRYHGMQQPSEHLVYQALGSLCSEGNVFHTGTTFTGMLVVLVCTAYENAQLRGSVLK